MHVGIIGHGTWIPSALTLPRTSPRATGVPEDVIALKFGVQNKPVAGPGETTAQMGLEAARRALASAGIEGSQVDLVIWCGGQHKDYPCWLAGLYVADQIGARNAWSFDMEAMCGSMMAALDVAKALIIAREDLHTVLLVSGYRNNDLIDLAEPATRFMLDIGSGGLGTGPAQERGQERRARLRLPRGRVVLRDVHRARRWERRPGRRSPRTSPARTSSFPTRRRSRRSWATRPCPTSTP